MKNTSFRLLGHSMGVDISLQSASERMSHFLLLLIYLNVKGQHINRGIRHDKKYDEAAYEHEK